MKFMDNFAHSMQSAGQTKKIVISALLLLFLPALVLVANMTTRQGSKAAGTAIVTLVPSANQPAGTTVGQSGNTWILPVNKEVTIDVQLTTGNEEAVVSTYQVSYDPTVIALRSAASTTPRNNIRCNPSLPNIMTGEWLRRVDAVAPSAEGILNIGCGVIPLSDWMSVPIYQTVASRPAGSTDAVAVPKNTTMTVATLTFTTLQQAQGKSLAFDTNGVSGVIGWQPCHQSMNSNDCVTNDPRNSILQTANNMAFDIGTVPSGATFTFGTPVPAAPFYSSSTTSDRFTVPVTISTGGQNVSGADLRVNFTASDLQVISITGTNTNFNYQATLLDNTQGFVEISGLLNIPTGTPTGTITGINGSNLNFALITFEPRRVTAPSTTTLSVDFNAANPQLDNSSISPSNSTSGADLLTSQPTPSSFAITAAPTNIPTNTPTPVPPTATPVPPTATPTRTPTPVPPTATPTATTTPVPPTATPTRTPTPTATPVPPTPTNTPVPPTPTPTSIARIPVTITITLQGRAWKANNMARELLVQAYSGATEVLNRIFTSTAAGQVSDATNLTLPAGSLSLLVKPDGFLNGRIPATVSTTSTSFSFSTDLKAGDLNGTGKVESFDYTILLANFKKNTAGGTAAVTTADLDGSGQVNSLDFSLMLSNWGLCDVDQTGQPIQTDCINP